jgi:hypothetical protein
VARPRSRPPVRGRPRKADGSADRSLFGVLRHHEDCGWNRLRGNRGAELDALRAAQSPAARPFMTDLAVGGVVRLCALVSRPSGFPGLSKQSLVSRWTLPVLAEPGGEVRVRVPDGCAHVGWPFSYRAMYIACYAKGFAAAVAAAAAVEVAG